MIFRLLLGMLLFIILCLMCSGEKTRIGKENIKRSKEWNELKYNEWYETWRDSINEKD